MKTYFVIRALNVHLKPFAYWYPSDHCFYDAPDDYGSSTFPTKAAALTCIQNTEELHHYILTIEEVIIPWGVKNLNENSSKNS